MSASTLEQKIPARWLDDGFFHPPARLDREFVDVDQFVHVRLSGIERDIQFFRVEVGTGGNTSDHVVVRAPERSSHSVLQDAVSERYPGASCVFVLEDREGFARVATSSTPISFECAAAVALSRYAAAWDEARTITVVDLHTRHELVVTYEDETHWVVPAAAAQQPP